MIGNMHYATFSDLAWSADGRILIVASTDGYCSLVSFEEGELGEPLPSDYLASFIKNHREGAEIKSTVVTEVGSCSSFYCLVCPATSHDST